MNIFSIYTTFSNDDLNASNNKDDFDLKALSQIFRKISTVDVLRDFIFLSQY